jgi:HEAT repeat protein
LDWHALPTIKQAVTSDGEVSVRVAAVKALGRLNSAAGNEVLSRALGDKDAKVRKTALDQVLKVGFFRDADAILARLDDSDASVRRASAQLAGEMGIKDAVEPLMGLLMTDDTAQVRQAAAIALGKLGGDGLAALDDAKTTEKDEQVLGAIDIASRMH